ncbi:hypothetical protein SDRG_14814 [Saprolegnia diclina VS20]|uniref:BZIP domain-containing protein n=1 Tax=Saprolegnia diclina (strain VS20) TaxID=1156394 RepID=T0RCR9_SAPDV|nr:hypothetical protein SDRG_14814 [Saprolegnia diclina VS20]EQC27372.1 hypothetical protein SDRG_14814 [Saprolegnia diclina VS20]|eukprot:XP_008619191.1 hypothetical protein SDRG_14814 [Saprolegnia diclina VS20]
MQPQRPRRVSAEWIPYDASDEQGPPSGIQAQGIAGMARDGATGEPTPWLRAFIEEDEHSRLEIKKERHRRDSSRYRERKIVELEALRQEVSELEEKVDSLQEARQALRATNTGQYKARATQEKLQLGKATDERAVLGHTIEQQKNLIDYYTKRLAETAGDA